jgi:hypothetical protein
MLKLAETVKYSALQEAAKNREGVEQTLTNTVERYAYYQQLLCKKLSDIKQAIPKLEKLDANGLAKMKFQSSEPSLSSQDIDFDFSSSPDTEGGIAITKHEAEELSKEEIAHDIQMGIQVEKILATALKPIPDAKLALHFWGIGGDIGNLPGGTMLSELANLAADIASAVASQFSYEAGRAGKVAGFANRQREYQFQSNSAAGEITQLFKQLRASEIREAMAKIELDNHRKQIEQAAKIEEFLKDKPSNQDLYAWMKREVKGLYGKCFQFAFDVAKKAERALQQELGDPNLKYIEYGYMAGKEGLLAGETLYQDIKRMEMAYIEQNRREYELTKHVSLLQVNPVALLQLRNTGSCSFSLPEEIYDFDCPGHYFRRLRSLAISTPCLLGAYGSVNCRLTLTKSSIRISPLSGDDYARRGADDPRFNDSFGSAQAIVTSTGQSDSGLFETNLHDERKLPFELCGAISEWRLDLPEDVRQFDYNTIADVILHVRYTAREGGDTLRASAVTSLNGSIDAASTSGSVRLFSVRQEFPADWAKFKSAPSGSPFSPLTLTIRPEHYPFWSQGRLESVLGFSLFANTHKDIQVTDKSDGTVTDTLVKNDSLGGIRSGALKNVALPAPTGRWTFYFSDNSMTDLWLAARWGKQA